MRLEFEKELPPIYPWL